MTFGFLKPSHTSSKLQAAIDDLASSAEADSRGAVFTRLEVVDFILTCLAIRRINRSMKNGFWSHHLGVAISYFRLLSDYWVHGERRSQTALRWRT
jgi:hypothetical protein